MAGTATRRGGGARPGARRTGRRPVRGGRPAARRRWPVLLGLAVITVLVVLLHSTPLLGVRSIRVVGETELTRQQVVDAAGVPPGTPMLQVDTEQVRARLEQRPTVASAEVSLSWPSTVEVAVTDRVAVAYVVAREAIRLVGPGGMPFEAVPAAPPGLPELRVARVAQDDPTTTAALSVLLALPPQVRAEVTAVVAERPGDVHLRLTGDREVHWGAAEANEHKAAILPPLLTREGRVYDVTAPTLPTVAS
ncbi:cell division protein FtsQ/DivIB [Saccharopolyspora sp. CA-218241]|uniref:cell division protein FtsQ/DivIB n=1 Tax=Saccharopolyspora sp. CA-218241 TaxID=3240027 RepID=UPI003D9900E7